MLDDEAATAVRVSVTFVSADVLKELTNQSDQDDEKEGRKLCRDAIGCNNVEAGWDQKQTKVDV